MKLLVCNAGSTSLKFKLFDMPAETVLAEGKVERVGTDTAIYHFSKPDGFRIFRENLSIPTYTEFSLIWRNLNAWASRQFSPKVIMESMN